MIQWPLELDPDTFRDRLSWARKQGHPHYFWRVPMPAWRAGLRQLEAAVTELLAARSASLRAGTQDEARALGVAAYTSGVGPLLGYWIENGRLRADPLLAELFSVHLLHGRRRAARLRAELERAATALEAAGIGALVVKSAHTATEYFPEPGTRPAIDVDFVVEPAAFDRAERALAAAGYAATVREFRPRKTTWLAPGSARVPRSLEVVHAESQYAIDLHASLERNFFGVRTVGPGSPGETPGDLMSGPGSVRVLRQPELLLYHALHTSEGLYNLTLVRLIELVLIIRRDGDAGTLDWGAFRALVADREAWRFIYPALELTERLAPGTVEPETLERARAAAPARMIRVLNRLSPGAARRLEGRSLDETFMWCVGPVEHLRRVVHMLFPAPAGRSPRRLLRYYVDRGYLLLRRIVSVTRPPARTE